MNDVISKELFEHIIERLLNYQKDAKEELDNNKDDSFSLGKDLAYIEMIDVIKIELEANGYDLKEYGLL